VASVRLTPEGRLEASAETAGRLKALPPKTGPWRRLKPGATPAEAQGAGRARRPSARRRRDRSDARRTAAENFAAARRSFELARVATTVALRDVHAHQAARLTKACAEVPTA
jgi:hypothetical protein